MYSEITEKLFNFITDDIVPYEIEPLENASKAYWKKDDVVLVSIYNYISNVEQYYIQDINS